MSSYVPINLWEHDALLYKTKSFEYNRYYIDHPDVKGVLRLATIPVDVIRVDKSKVPEGYVIDDGNKYIVSTNTAVMFVNRKRKKKPTGAGSDSSSCKKINILQHIVKEQVDEPWCEYVVQDRPEELLRIRTVLTDVHYCPDVITPIGDPYIMVKHTNNIAVTYNAAPESGMP